MSKPMLVVLALIVAGGAYGYASGVYNVNPNPMPGMSDVAAPPEQLKAVREWSPSPLWLPAYLVATVPHRTISPRQRENGPAVTFKDIDVIGYGLENRCEAGAKQRYGWAFSSAMGKTHYQLASMSVGAGIGLVIAIIISLSLGWVTLRRAKPEPEEEPKPKKVYTTWP